MCGIIGICAQSVDVVDDVMRALERLEYRGYDSAGLAVMRGGEFQRVRAAGKLKNLRRALVDRPLSAEIAIGHTRWATHGVPNEENAHPHLNESVALIHNGIIENYLELKANLAPVYQQKFSSETDTEVLIYLLSERLDAGAEPMEALRAIKDQLKGAFAFVAMFKDRANSLIAMRKGSPLAIGIGDGLMAFGSDALSMAHICDKIIYLEDGDYALIEHNKYYLFDADGNAIKRAVNRITQSGMMIGKGNFQHFMQKEIFEQPDVVANTLHAILNQNTRTISLECDVLRPEVARINMTACGTAFYAGLVAKFWAEYFCKFSMECDIASEFRYRLPPLDAQALGLVVSQSGETMDSLEALKYMKGKGIDTLSIVNVAMSSIARASSATLLTKAGPEVGVASTKAFTTQLMLLAGVVVSLAQIKGLISPAETQEYVNQLSHVPSLMSLTLNHAEQAKKIANLLDKHSSALYLGRGPSYPIALEGALKLKEISYIHAEGYAAGEMKHGPIALIEKKTPVIAICPEDEWFEKTCSNLQEAEVRGAMIIAISSESGLANLKKRMKITAEYEIPPHHSFISPFLTAIPIQLIAYYTAVKKGTDVDQPRNLAKSVTVE